jgi:hypothetical protein
MSVFVPAPDIELLRPCNFLSRWGAKSISAVMWCMTLVPDTELLNPLEFSGF